MRIRNYTSNLRMKARKAKKMKENERKTAALSFLFFIIVYGKHYQRKRCFEF